MDEIIFRAVHESQQLADVVRVTRMTDFAALGFWYLVDKMVNEQWPGSKVLKLQPYRGIHYDIRLSFDTDVFAGWMYRQDPSLFIDPEASRHAIKETVIRSMRDPLQAKMPVTREHIMLWIYWALPFFSLWILARCT